MASHQQSEMPPHTPEVFEVLKQCAADGDTIPYGKLAARVEGSGADARSVLPALDYIRDCVCLPCDLPWLWMLAVRQGKNQPGPGAWNNTGGKFSGGGQWGEILRKIYAYPDWSEIKIEDPCPDRRSDVPRGRP